MFDVLIKDGMVYDGKGTSPVKENIGIKGDRIYLLKTTVPSSRKTINSEGLIVSPGFIDIHSHTDEIYFLNPKAESKVRQGISTEVVGNCGTSPFPLGGSFYNTFKRRFKAEYGTDIVSWKEPWEFYEKLNKSGIGINSAFLTGHGNLRYIIGKDKPGKISSSDLNKMKRILSRCLEHGSFGMSTGLAYTPSGFADTHELCLLSKVLSKYNALYTTHLRSEEDTLIEAVKEAIEIARISGVKVQISHHKASGKRNWGKTKNTLKLIKDARDNGCIVHCDQYPYTASCTSLDMVLPRWVREKRKSEILKILKNKSIYLKVARQISQDSLHSPDSILISEVIDKSSKKFEGMYVDEIARKLKKDPEEVVLDLIIKNNFDVSSIFFNMCEEDIQRVLLSPFTCISSDATARANHGILSKGKPHPRSYGAFPRVIARYVKDKKILSMGEAIKKMTYLPAKIMGFLDRGRIKEGYKADIVIFGAKTIKDMATYKDPHRYARGIKYLFINGKLVLNNGSHTGVLAGHILYR